MGLSDSKAKNAFIILDRSKGVYFTQFLTKTYFQLSVGLFIWFSVLVSLILDILNLNLSSKCPQPNSSLPHLLLPFSHSRQVHYYSV